MHKIIERPEYVYDNLDNLGVELKVRGETMSEVERRLGFLNPVLSAWRNGYRMPTRENYNKLAEYLGWRLW